MMENLSLNDPPPPPGSPQRQMGQMPQPSAVLPDAQPQGPPQLPPQMFTTAAQLLDLTDSMSLSTPKKYRILRLRAFSC
jgi:U6 snRNA-associated Sm-like protein LSm1